MVEVVDGIVGWTSASSMTSTQVLVDLQHPRVASHAPAVAEVGSTARRTHEHGPGAQVTLVMVVFGMSSPPEGCEHLSVSLSRDCARWTQAALA